MEKLIEQVFKKVGMQKENDIVRKTAELLTLLSSRCTNSSLQINEYCKVVLCLDLAAEIFGKTIDKELALQVSGLRKSAYASKRRMFQKLLDIENVVGVNDICTQLNINELTRKSQVIFDVYKSAVVKERDDVDISHPQYAAMAVYQACKLNKKRISKLKIQSFSNLRPAQWSQLEKRWDELLAKYQNDVIGYKSKGNIINESSEETSGKCKIKENKSEMSEINTIEDYEVWKCRMITEAKKKLGI